MLARGLVLAALAAGTARADQVVDLLAKGQELAKLGEWSQAIAAFKQADAQRPRAEHACMIGLAYTRRELWPQAELWFARCHQRATTGDPLPEWLAEAEAQLAAKIAAIAITPIAFTTTPSHAKIWISGFEPDETMEAGTIHLNAGRYVVEVSAPQMIGARRELAVVTGTPQTIDFVLPPLVPPPTPPSTTLPWLVLGAGGALVLAGVATDLFKLQGLRDQLRQDQASFDAHETEFDSWQFATVGMWAGGAILVGIGAYLAVRSSSSVSVSASLDRHGAGASFAIGWTR